MSTYSAFTDLELTSLLKNSDAAAYTVIYNRYFHTLYIHALQKLNNKEEAQDVVHELFTQLWNKREDLNINSNLIGYLYTGIRNKVLDVMAHQKVESKYVDSLQGFLETNYSITDHRIREKQLAELIDKGIASLPRKMREVFELSRKQSLSHKEIALQLNLSEQTVKKQIYNALRILKTKIASVLVIVC